MAMFPGELKEASRTVAISPAKIGRWQLTVYLHTYYFLFTVGINWNVTTDSFSSFNFSVQLTGHLY